MNLACLHMQQGVANALHVFVALYLASTVTTDPYCPAHVLVGVRSNSTSSGIIQKSTAILKAMQTPSFSPDHLMAAGH